MCMGMLILTRRVGESIMISDDIKITVLGTRGTQVKIGIEAPKDVTILREELLGSGETLLGFDDEEIFESEDGEGK